MKKNFAYLLTVGAFAVASYVPLLNAAAADTADTTRRLDESATVFSEIMGSPDHGIPHDLLERAHCIAIVPGVKKAAFIVGAKYGKGFISCRRETTGHWSAPAAIRVEGGSFGFQIGGSDTDVVLLVMNEGGVKRLLQDKFTLGGEGSIAAGPVGRDASAQTDAQMSAEILSWSRTRGVFAGISLTGATLRQDLDDNAALYGERLTNRQIVRERETAPPQGAGRLMEELNRYGEKR
jgi:lipid-binding SYLF domain-containing protein